MIVPILPVLAAIVLVVSLVGTIVSLLPAIQPSNTTSQVQLLARIFAFEAAAIVIIYLVLLIGSFAMFFFIDRRNKHFRRQQMLFSATASYFQAKNPVISRNVERLSELADDSLVEEEARPAGLWAILGVFVTPLVGLIVAYTLTQDLQKHEQTQSAYQETLTTAIEETGAVRPSFSASRVHKRDPMVYLILAAITAGLFWIYWFFVLLKDYNEHFSDQAMFEDQILVSLKPSVVCRNCGGPVPSNAKFCPLCGASQSAG